MLEKEPGKARSCSGTCPASRRASVVTQFCRTAAPRSRDDGERLPWGLRWDHKWRLQASARNVTSGTGGKRGSSSCWWLFHLLST